MRATVQDPGRSCRKAANEKADGALPGGSASKVYAVPCGLALSAAPRSTASSRLVAGDGRNVIVPVILLR
jgi:hypothetical protein